MKVQASKVKTFEPVEVTIRIESVEELSALWRFTSASESVTRFCQSNLGFGLKNTEVIRELLEEMNVSFSK